MRLDKFGAKIEADAKKAAGPHTVGRVVIVGYGAQEEAKVKAIVEKAGFRPGLTIRYPAVEEVRVQLTKAGLPASDVMVMPGEANVPHRDVHVRSAMW